MKLSRFRCFLITFSLGFVDLAIASPAHLDPAHKNDSKYLTELVMSGSRMGGAQLQVEVSDHIAVLTGETENLDQMEWATSLLYSVREVYGVVQSASVSGDYYDREEAAEMLHYMFAHAPSLEGTRLQAEFRDQGEVVITGVAGNHAEVAVARELASRLGGVREVHVEARLDGRDLRSLSQIASQLRFLVTDDPLFERSSVEFAVNGDQLRVAGDVASDSCRSMLQDMCHAFAGNTSVENTVRMDASLPRSEFSRKIYHPHEALTVLRSIYEADPRLGDNQFTLSASGPVIRVDAQKDVTEGQAGALLASGRAIPGIMNIKISNPVAKVPALSSR